SAVEVGVALKGFDDAIQVANRRTVETTKPPTEVERRPWRPPLTDTVPSGGLPRWAVAVPIGLALLALLWGWSRGDEVEALRRVEAYWIERLQTGATQEKISALQTLGEIGTAGDESFDALVGALDDPEPQVRAAAATALGELGEDARPASSKLLELRQKDEWPDVRMAASAAHDKITGKAQPGSSQ
ncbi:MAG TPA: HEAT repeat domain-containing protein, partial [Planctomycetaceae bacterium]